MADGVSKWRRKRDEPSRYDLVYAAQYQPGLPLSADLVRVARMATAGRVTEACLPQHDHWGAAVPAGRVLLAAWHDVPDDRPGGTRYEVVEPGQYLTYSEQYGSLDAQDGKSLERWYTREGGDG